MIDVSRFNYNTPITRKILNIAEGKNKYVEIGLIGLLCPNCLNIENIINIDLSSTIDNISFMKDFCIETSYHGECHNCKEYVEFECIDINMAQIVQILNSKGYYTAFSCEGHIEPDAITHLDTFSPSYIYFYFWEDSEILKEYPLPKTWHLPNDNIKSEIFSIYDNIINTLPKEISCIDNSDEFISWLHINWDKENRLKDIYNWAVSLPDKDEDFKKKQFELSKVHGNMMLIENSERYEKIHNSKLF